MGTLEERIAALEKIATALATEPPAVPENAKVLMSGGLPRLRVHWSQEIYQWDRIALTAPIAIWTICLHSGAHPWGIASASGLSSLLMGFWRLQVRVLDDNIASLYTETLRCEIALGMASPTVLPRRGETKNRAKSVVAIREDYTNRLLGSRGHLFYDWIALVTIVAMLAVTLGSTNEPLPSTATWLHSFKVFSHWLIALNILGFCFVFFAMNFYQTRRGRVRRVLGSLWAKHRLSQ